MAMQQNLKALTFVSKTFFRLKLWLEKYNILEKKFWTKNPRIKNFPHYYLVLHFKK